MEADAAFQSKDYKRAASRYRAAGRAMPKSAIEEDALFMHAESLLFLDEYPDAFTAYEELLQKYKRTRHLDKAVARIFRIGVYWNKLHVDDPHWITTPNLTDKTRPATIPWGTVCGRTSE